jgi:hypothetical protein
VSGSIEMLPEGSSSSSPGPPPIELTDPNAAARVTDTSGATQTVCADVVPVDFQLAVRHTGGTHAVIEVSQSPQLPAGGRCAGPTPADLAALVLPARPLGSGGYDFSGRTTFGAGPFTVTAISTVRAPFTHGSAGLGSVGAPGAITSIAVGPAPTAPRLPTVLQEHAEIAYRVVAVTGGLATAFAGLAPPLCSPLGACGTAGTVTETFKTSGTISFFGTRTVKRRVSAGRTLADLRAGRLAVYTSFDGLPIAETATETVTGPGTLSCADTRTEGPFPGQSSRRGRHAIELAFAGSGGTFVFGDGGIDPLRTRCPGPASADVVANGPLAAATVPLSTLGRRPLSLTFTGGGPFTGSAYTGQRGGSVVLSLIFAHASGGTTRTPVFPGPPGLP